MTITLLALALLATPEPLSSGDHVRTLEVDQRTRSYLIHVPPSYDASKPTPVVLILHGAVTNAAIMERYTGMNATSDEKGFLAVYPNGTGTGAALFWNAGGWLGRKVDENVDDVKFLGAVLDDVEAIANVDRQRVFATGLSNGAMMCYRLAAEMSERIAAIGPVAGTMVIDQAQPDRPVPLIHFHGMVDPLVPPDGPGARTPRFLRYRSLDDSVEIWRQINRCSDPPLVNELPDRANDGTTVQRSTYHPREGGAEIVVYRIFGGGHTWPGGPLPMPLLGKTTEDISANDLMWEFFEKHALGVPTEEGGTGK